MKNKFLSELIVSLIIIVLLILLINPFEIWMPTAMHMVIFGSLAVLFMLFAGIVWKEKAADEREMLHRAAAGRFAYLAGTLVLAVGVIYEGLQHQYDNWLIVTLGVMILVKIISSIYINLTN